MRVCKTELAEIFGVSTRTVTEWQAQGLPLHSGGGGNGGGNSYDTEEAIAWYVERDCEIENEKLRKEVEDLRKVGESELEPGTIDFERYRLIKAQADAQELKNARDEAEVIDTAFCTFVLSRMANDIAAILDGIPLAVQRRFPNMDKSQLAHLKTQIARAMNKAIDTSERIPVYLDEYIETTTNKAG